MSQLNFWYHSQVRQYLLQFIRIFGNFQIQTGKGKDGTQTMYRVPVRYADMDRMVGHILRKNSENLIQSCPFMTCMIAGLEPDDQRRQVPNHISQVQVSERAFDREAGKYGRELGDTYSVHRMMPVPYKLTMEVDIWTRFTDHKLQLLEQILVLFNPAIDLQTSTNPIDWTALTTVTLTNVSWSDQSVPAGTEENIDVAKLTFEVPIWLNPPTLVKKQKIIHQIVTNIFDGVPSNAKGEPDDLALDWVPIEIANRILVTPGQHMIRVERDIITLLDSQGNETDPDGRIHAWGPLLDRYGHVEPGVSRIRLRITADLEDWTKDIIGSFVFHPTAANKLIWTVDPETLPRNDLPPITAMIDPHRNHPGKGLPAAAPGQRYLLAVEVGPDTAWGEVTALANDIIEYRNGRWEVVFASAGDAAEHFCLNAFDGSRLRWTGEDWVDAIDGDYYPGYWRVTL